MATAFRRLQRRHGLGACSGAARVGRLGFVMWRSFSGMVLDPVMFRTLVEGLKLSSITGTLLTTEIQTIFNLIDVDVELLIAKLHICYLA